VQPVFSGVHLGGDPRLEPAAVPSCRYRQPALRNIALTTKMDMVVRTPDAVPQAPPNKGESVMAWLQRIRRLIDEYNVRQVEVA
jgi:hypothetical protein